MEDKIEVGEYVRSNLGSIGKVTKIEEGKFLYENKCLICFISKVVKHSKNIIDLIEAGDYVNGCRVEEIIGNTIMIFGINQGILEEDIRSIATKEEFEKIEYKVEG